MTAEERVLTALNNKKPDRVPIYNSFWPEFEEQWRREKNVSETADIGEYYDIDIYVYAPIEAPFPSICEEEIKSDGTHIKKTSWGSVQRSAPEKKFYEVLEVALPDKKKIDSLQFESPLLDSRFKTVEEIERLRQKYCVIIKTGGPYLRTSNLRGTTQWLFDLVEDPDFAYELAMLVTRQMTEVGLEALRRYDLYHTGIWFYDDMGSNNGLMFSPKIFEKVFYPCYRWMAEQYRKAGVNLILLHCDGNFESILDMLIDAGIQGINPVEPKAGMDVVALKKKYGRKLMYLGGLDNAHILPGADLPELEKHIMHVLEAGEDGGLVIGAHSIGPDISVERYDHIHRFILEHGKYE